MVRNPADLPTGQAGLPDAAGKNRLSPLALSVQDAARLLTATGGKTVTAEMIQADIDSGAPVSTDGTINLVHYAAWLVKGMGRGA